mgnify:FL=1
MDVLTLRNRFPETPFIGMYDGKTYVVKDRLTLPVEVARHVHNRSVIRDNPVTGEREYRLAIVEEEGDLENLTALPAETLDRSDFDSLRKVEIIDMRNPVVPPARTAGGSSVRSTSK